MIGSFLKKFALLLTLYCVPLPGEDILENFRPAPELPAELNRWFASVQRHKDDFELIRYAAQKLGKYDMGVSNDFKNEEKREFKPKYLIDLDEDEAESYSEEKPENDIYPYMYRRRVMEPVDGVVEIPMSAHSNSRLRLRRDSAEARKFSKRNNVKLEIKANNGEVFRSADKYPGRYKNDPKSDVNKRDIHIDVYSDGKLIKQTNTGDSKAIILNIQPSEQPFINNQNIQSSEAKRSDMVRTKFLSPIARSSGRKTDSKDETNNNFRNLFVANEHLNTDTSTHFQNPIIYHVSLPDINTYLKSATTEEINSLMDPSSSNGKTHFNQNGLEDMSPYWSPTEKNIMQKGLEVAQKIVNLPSRTSQSVIDKNGFEHVESIVIDDSERKSRLNDKRQLEARNHLYQNRIDSVAPVSYEGEYTTFDPQALQRKIFDANQMIRNPYRYETQNFRNPYRYETQNFEYSQPEETKIFQENNEIDDIPERKTGNNRYYKNMNQDEEDNNQFNIDSPQREVYPQAVNLNSQKEIESESTNLNRPRNQAESRVLLDENMIENNQQQQYCDGTHCQSNGMNLKYETVNDLEYQQKVANAIPLENTFPLKTYGDYDNPNVQIKFDNPSKSNGAIVYIPNNSIRTGKQQPLDTSEFDNIKRKRRDFLLRTYFTPPQTHDYLTLSNENQLNSVDTRIGDQYAVPSVETNEMPLEDLNPVHLPMNEQEKQEIDPIPNLLETENVFLNAETTTFTNIFSEPYPDVDESITTYSEPYEESILDLVNTKNHDHQDNNEEENITDAVTESDNDELGTENETIEDTSIKPAVLIVINPEEKDEVVEEDITESLPTIQSEIPFKTEKPQEATKKHHNYHYKHYQKPLQRIEKIQEHIETHRLITKVETFTIENIHQKDINCSRRRTDTRTNQNSLGISNELKVDPMEYIYKKSLSPRTNNKISHHEKWQLEKRTHSRGHPKQTLKNHWLVANKNYGKIEPRRITTLSKRKHHRDRQKKPKRIEVNWGFNNIKNYIANEKALIDNPDKDSDSIPAFVGRQLKSIDYIYDADLGYPDLEEVVHKKSNKESQHYRKRKVEKIFTSTIRGSLHKDSAEGDYGEEEESDNEKEKKGDYKIVKKTNNDFANPVAKTTDPEEEYNDEDYKEGGNQNSQNNDKKSKQKLETKTTPGVTDSFGRRLHTKVTPLGQKKMIRGKNKEKKRKRPRNVRQESKKLVWKRDNQKQKFVPNQKFLRNSEFQQWPKFMRNDQDSEEILRKRSLATTGQSEKTITFPLSTNSFFVTSQLCKKTTMGENGDKSLGRKAAFVADEEKNAVSAANALSSSDDISLTSVAEMETVNLPDISVNLDSDAKLIDTLIPISITNETPFETIGSFSEAHASSENNTTNECAEPLQDAISNACEDNPDFFNHTQIPITSVLPLVSEIENPYGETYESFEKLDPIINGEIPFKILDHIFSQLTNHLGHFRKGLKRTYTKDSLDNILDTSNMESKKIITEMTNLLNKLQISTNCQVLHPRLTHYLKLITRAKPDTVLRRAKEMEGKLLDENQNHNNKKNFVFTSSELSDNLEDKASVLKGLLTKYHNLPDQCKPRALPLKEYIERHLGMLNTMLAEDDSKSVQYETEHSGPVKVEAGETYPAQGPVKHRSLQRTTTEGVATVNDENALIDQQLENLGLGENPNFTPNFDLNDLMAQNRHRKDTNRREKSGRYGKRSKRRDVIKRHSESYEKLLNAISREKIRKVRENRLGQMYGKFKDDLFNYNEKPKRDVNGFESPLVYSF